MILTNYIPVCGKEKTFPTQQKKHKQQNCSLEKQEESSPQQKKSRQ